MGVPLKRSRQTTYCSSCFRFAKLNRDCDDGLYRFNRNSDPLKKITNWTWRVDEEIAIPEVAATTGLDVLTQGYTVGPISCIKAEKFFLQQHVRSDTLNTSFFFLDMRVPERVANLTKIQKERAVKIPQADAKANALIAGYTNRFGRSPGTLSGAEYKFFMTTCEGMSLVTSQDITGKTHDLVYICCGFVGNKTIYGITILRQLVLELLVETKAFREQWQTILDGPVERNSKWMAVVP
ncbi:hypothetical protein EC957_000347 [Mortierella hygrophila]|uniref:Uncharacterized protein n=1 Tax=Mortierella hygrophila TaxID=979708 RepID=A0A9P6K2Y9_9FUNG|nr:hypothetical protein EC957_000347 [Mortierella hygrophila]